MKQSTFIALGFACSYAGVKLGVFFAGLQHHFYASFILFILPVLSFLSVLVTLYYKNRLISGTDILQDVKICLRTTSLFAVFIAAYTYVHYKYIDATFFEVRNAIMKGDGELPEVVDIISVPFNVATIDLIVLMGTGFLCSFLFAALNKKFVNRN